MENVMKKVGRASSFLTKYIGIIIICFSVIAFFWRDGFAWTTNYTSIFLGVAMFGMGLTIKMDDFKRVFQDRKKSLSDLWHNTRSCLLWHGDYAS